MQDSGATPFGRGRIGRALTRAMPGRAATPSASEAVAIMDLAAERLRDVAEASARAATDIGACADTYAAANSVNPTRIDRERLVTDLAASLAQRADELSRDAASLEAILERARGRLLASRPVAPPPDETSEPAPARTQPSPEPAPARTQPSPEPPALASVEGESDLARRVSDHFGSPPETAGRFNPRAVSPGSPEPAAPKSASREGLRLLATQMAVAGSSREEIEARLRSEFGVTDASRVLLEVLGPARGS